MPSPPSSSIVSSTTPRATPDAPWWRAFLPAPMAVNGRERRRVMAGAALGIGLTAWLCHHFGMSAWPWMAAPIGASAVLVFGVPASPLAQPWSVVGGNTLSALVGIACLNVLGPSPQAAALAVALAIGLMFALRCLHPPGGASALLPVLAGIPDVRFAVFPMLVNSLLLVAVGIAYNRATGRRYPHAQQAQADRKEQHRGAHISEADLDAVLARYNQVLDVPRDDLKDLLEQAELLAYRRRLGQIRCEDIMSRDVIAVEYGTSLQDAWSLLREKRIKALPVVDRAHRIVGIVTLADFMRGADLDIHDGFEGRLKALIRRTTAMRTDKPEVVGQIMTRQVRVASAGRHIVDLVPLFSATGHHHIPIVGENGKLVGILTQSDLVRALSHVDEDVARH